jgi:hypothetical protein
MNNQASRTPPPSIPPRTGRVGVGEISGSNSFTLSSLYRMRKAEVKKRLCKPDDPNGMTDCRGGNRSIANQSRSDRLSRRKRE